MEFYTIITDAGRAAVADAIATGGKVDLVQLAAGDGGGQAVQPVPSQQALAGEAWRGELSTYTVDGDVLTLSSFIPAEAMAFTLREMGVFTADGMLFAVCNTPEIRHVPPEEGVVGDLTLGMQLKISTLEQDALTIQTNPDLDFIPNREKGAAGGVAPLGPDGKVPEENLPEMDYDPSGSSAAVQSNLDTHIANQGNPHGVTAAQVGALPTVGGTMTGAIDMNSQQLINLAAPVSASDAARKSDVDAVISLAQGLIVAGTYTGEGYRETTPRNINLGFRPKAVLVYCKKQSFRGSDGMHYGGLATGNSGAAESIVRVNSTGFTVSNYGSGDQGANVQGYLYSYFAFR